MIAVMNERDRYEEQSTDSTEFDTFERFTYRRGGEFPVRSHTARTRGKLRSRGHATRRRKTAAFNGANRRGSGKQWRRAS